MNRRVGHKGVYARLKTGVNALMAHPTMLCLLARNPASEALMDEPIEVAEVADRDRQTALKSQLEARVVLFWRSRYAADPWNAVGVLGRAWRRQHDRGNGQCCCDESHAHCGSPLQAFPFDCKEVPRAENFSGRHLIPTRPARDINSA